MALATVVTSKSPVRLRTLDPRDSDGVEKEATLPVTAALTAELGELQELLFAASTHGLLVILQGMDTSGKDGAVRSVFRDTNPVGMSVVSFKAPTESELAHDFLWRVHQRVPEKGRLAVFNRSHYEDVGVVRVHELVPRPVWEKRYARINDFERLLAESGTLVFKFFLNISMKEQEERLLAREKDDGKAWKLAVSDWRERLHWDLYMEAYEDAINRCATDQSPWHVVPADRKWYRDYVIAHTLVEALRPYREVWNATLAKRGIDERAAIAAFRAENPGR